MNDRSRLEDVAVECRGEDPESAAAIRRAGFGYAATRSQDDGARRAGFDDDATQWS